MSKYIDVEHLKELLNNKHKEFTDRSKNFCFMQYQFMADGLTIAEQVIDSLQQEQPDFPTTDEETEMLLATHSKVEVPNKYKTPDWLWKKLKQSEVDFEDVWKTYYDDHLFNRFPMPSKRDVARHFYELGLKAK